MEDDLERLAERARDGDRDAFSRIVAHMQQRVFRYCYPMLGNREDAEDATQEVFLRAYRRMATYTESRSFAGWLYTIAHHACMEKHRKKHRFSELFHRLKAETAHSQALGSDDEALSLLSALPARAKSVVVLRVLHDMTYEQIGEMLGESPAKLRKRFERARKRLRMAMKTQHLSRAREETCENGG